MLTYRSFVPVGLERGKQGSFDNSGSGPWELFLNGWVLFILIATTSTRARWFDRYSVCFLAGGNGHDYAPIALKFGRSWTLDGRIK